MDGLILFLAILGVIMWLITRGNSSGGGTLMGKGFACGTCNGTGRVPVTHWVSDREYSGTEACGHCHGRGSLKEKRRVESSDCPDGCDHGWIEVPHASEASRFFKSQDGVRRVKCKYIGKHYESDNGNCSYDYRIGYNGDSSYLYKYTIGACHQGKVRVTIVTREPY
jgi:DnaJ-class molecular chaperone